MTQDSLPETDQHKLTRLRSEDRRMKMEREILKKPWSSCSCISNTVSTTWCCLSDGNRPLELCLQGAGSSQQTLLCPKGMVVSDLLKAAD